MTTWSTAPLASLLLAVGLTGCISVQAEHTSPHATGVPDQPTGPDHFCDLATAALPDGWVLDEVEEDPYGNHASVCNLGTGFKGDTYTNVLVSLRPENTIEDTAERLVSECDRVTLISATNGASVPDEVGVCQGADQAEHPTWSMVAYTAPDRLGVIVARVDTTNRRHGKHLAADIRTFAADLLASIPQETRR